MTRLALASLALLAACRTEPVPANTMASPQVNAVLPADDRGVAERVVRRQLGNPRGLAFSNALVHVTGRVPIVCGDFEQGGRRERYIVVDGEAAWVESQMRSGEMDRAVREHCGGGERG